MASNPKKRCARMAFKRVNLTFEKLEARHLMSVSSPEPPMLEHMLAPPPLEQMETPPPLATNYTPMVYAGADLTVSIADGAVISGEVIANIPSSLSITWSLVSGPGSAVFSDENLPSTAVTFSQSGTYELELTAVNGGNGGAVVSDRVIVTVEGDTTTPTVPTGLQATPSSPSQIDLTWDASSDPESGVSKYRVYRDGNLVAEPTGTSFSDTVLVEDTTYTYAISAVNGEGLESATGTSVQATTPVPLSGPRAHWKLDEGSGTLAVDATGFGHDGTLNNGASWTTGEIDGAVALDGANDFIEVDAAPFNFNTWSAITVSAWVRSDTGADGTTNDIISQWDFPSSKSWVLTHHSNNQYFWDISGIGNVSGGSVSTDWTHVAATYDTVAGEMRLYQDGVEVASQTGLSGNLPASLANVIIGSQADGANSFDGSLDNVMIHDRALSASEVAALAASTPAAPVASDSAVTTAEGVAWNGSVSATDANGDPLTYILLSPVSSGTLNFNSNGSYSYTPGVGFLGTDSFTFKANDGGLDSNVATVTITVQELSDEEVLATNNPLSVIEGAAGTISSSRLTTTDSDNTPAELTYTITSGPSNGTVLLSGSATTSFTQDDIDNGRVSYDHDGSETTSDSFGFNVNDAQGPGTSGTFNINVTPVNDSPVAANDSFSTGVDTPLTQGASGGVLANDTDADGDPLSAVLVGGPSNGTLTLNPDGSFTYTPNAGFTGADTFSYKANDGTVDSNLATVAITIGSNALLTDSFEGTPPTGWDAGWNAVDFGNSTMDTTDAGGTPPGGGTYAYRQAWDNSSGRPGWLRYRFDTSLTGEGAVIEFDFYLKYHANFNTNNTWNKLIIMRNTAGRQPFVIDSFDQNGIFYAVFPLNSDVESLYANINGGTYILPKGEWVHFRWQLKISTESNGNPQNGYLYGWVNGTKRWEYDNINTINTGQYNEINLNSTFNSPVYGPNQERYWDLFNIGPYQGASGQSVVSSQSAEASIPQLQAPLALANSMDASTSIGGSSYVGFVNEQEATPTTPVARTSTTSYQLSTASSGTDYLSLFSDRDGLPNNDDTDLVFDHIGELRFFSDVRWTDVFYELVGK